MALMDLLKKKNLADQETVTTSAPVLNQPPAEQKPKTKRKRKTPQNESRRTRNSQVKIRLTVDEVDRLKNAAADAGLSMADFIMHGVDQWPVVKVPDAALIRANLFRCGANLNQAVRLGNKANREGRQVDLDSIKKAAGNLDDAISRFDALLTKWDAVVSREDRKEVTKSANC